MWFKQAEEDEGMRSLKKRENKIENSLNYIFEASIEKEDQCSSINIRRIMKKLIKLKRRKFKIKRRK